MPNLSSVIKSEITRLARKEIKTAVDPMRKANAGYRRDIAELKRQLATMQRELKTLSKPSRRAVATEATEATSTKGTRFVAKGVKSLRGRLGLSAAEFGRLVGASGQSVYNWETGKAIPRDSQKAALAAVRGLGKRDAAKRLESLA